MKNKEIKEPDRRHTVENLEINLMYILSMAIERIMNDIERRLAEKKSAYKMEKKMRLSNILKAIKNIKMNSDLIDQIDFGEGLVGNYDSYQYYQEDAYELARILLLFSDRHTKDVEMGYKTAKFLRSFEGEGIITEEVLERFYLKK